MYEKIFAYIYDPVMNGLEEKFLKEKRKILLKDIQSPILEIGSGTGANLSFYPKNSKLYLIEKSPYMIKKFKEKNSIQNFSQIIILEKRIDMDINFNQFPKFSSVVSTLVLCSVKDLEKTLKNIYQLLDTNGCFYVLEHIQSKKFIYKNVQNIISPFWKLLGDGCHINRKTDQILKKYFYPVYEEYFFWGIDFYLAKLKKQLYT